MSNETLSEHMPWFPGTDGREPVLPIGGSLRSAARVGVLSLRLVCGVEDARVVPTYPRIQKRGENLDQSN